MCWLQPLPSPTLFISHSPAADSPFYCQSLSPSQGSENCSHTPKQQRPWRKLSPATPLKHRHFKPLWSLSDDNRKKKKIKTLDRSFDQRGCLRKVSPLLSSRFIFIAAFRQVSPFLPPSFLPLARPLPHCYAGRVGPEKFPRRSPNFLLPARAGVRVRPPASGSGAGLGAAGPLSPSASAG